MKVIRADNLIYCIHSFVEKVPLEKFQRYAKWATTTTVAWYSYNRSVAKKIAWHDLGRIGGAGDVVEIDETQLFRRKYGVGRVSRMNSECVGLRWN